MVLANQTDKVDKQTNSIIDLRLSTSTCINYNKFQINFNLNSRSCIWTSLFFKSGLFKKKVVGLDELFIKKINKFRVIKQVRSIGVHFLSNHASVFFNPTVVPKYFYHFFRG